jgi:hypothetical protein
MSHSPALFTRPRQGLLGKRPAVLVFSMVIFHPSDKDPPPHHHPPSRPRLSLSICSCRKDEVRVRSLGLEGHHGATTPSHRCVLND